MAGGGATVNALDLGRALAHPASEVRVSASLFGFALIVLLGAGSARAQLVRTATRTPRGVELDRALVRVDRSVVTTSALLAEARLILLEEGGTAAANRIRFAPDDLEEVWAALDGRSASPEARDMAEFLGSVLAGMVHRALLQTEVRRLQLRSTSEEEVAEAYRALLARVPNPGRVPDALASAGFGRAANSARPPPELARLLKSESEVARVLDFREGSAATIPEAEVTRCLAARAEDLNVTRPEALARWRPIVLLGMREARVTRLFVDLLEQLQRRVEVQYAPPFEPRPLPEVPLCPSADDLRASRP